MLSESELIMVMIELNATVTDDHRLIVEDQIPAEVPPGNVKIMIEVAPEPQSEVNEARERARAKLEAAGALSTIWAPASGTVPLTVEERNRIGKLPENARPIEELIDEERGER